jgi:uncharacterized protein (DUF2235 family)
VEGRAMAKNIVILLDGTSNQISGDRTNVLRLYGSLERSRSQLVFYQPGVGTFGLNGWWQQLKSKTRIVLGLATGAGISDNVMQAYEFLVRNHEYGDRIYVFGFSRGSYTARLLAGFIRIFGLVRKEQLQLVRYAWRAYARLGQPGSKDFSAEIGHFQKVLDGKGIRIEFLGLWDTVASVFDAKVRLSLAHHHPEGLHQPERPGENRPPCSRHRRAPDLFPAIAVGTGTGLRGMVAKVPRL